MTCVRASGGSEVDPAWFTCQPGDSSLPRVLEAVKHIQLMLDQCRMPHFRGLLSEAPLCVCARAVTSHASCAGTNKSAEVCNCVLQRPNGLADIAWWQEKRNVVQAVSDTLHESKAGGDDGDSSFEEEEGSVAADVKMSPQVASLVSDIQQAAETLVQTMVPLIWSS